MASKPQSIVTTPKITKTPLEINVQRRLALREQKRQMVLYRLNDVPDIYLLIQSMLLFFLVLIYISFQIVIIVKKTSLFYVCSGFWVSAIHICCIISLYLLANNRTKDNLMYSLCLHILGSLANLGGIIIVNSLDMTLYNVTCIFACGVYTNQYLGLIMIIFGIIGFMACIAYLFVIDFLVLRHARALNIYLENRR